MKPTVKDLKEEVAALRDRLRAGGAAANYRGCCAYADSLVDKEGKSRFQDLSRLEWMLRVVVGYSRRQQIIIDKYCT